MLSMPEHMGLMMTFGEYEPRHGFAIWCLGFALALSEPAAKNAFADFFRRLRNYSACAPFGHCWRRRRYSF